VVNPENNSNSSVQSGRRVLGHCSSPSDGILWVHSTRSQLHGSDSATQRQQVVRSVLWADEWRLFHQEVISEFEISF